MRLLAGASGWAYPAWRGRFYPEKCSARRFLAEYAARLPTVEANGTFRTMPTRAQLAGWVADVPPGFVFAIKAPEVITHRRRLQNCRDELRTLAAALKGLGATRGPLLLQLPPNFKADVPRLAAFLRAVPRGQPVAIEFRHPSWFTDETYATLAKRNAALCLAEDDERDTPLVATADWGYLRLRKARYGPAALRRWAAFVAAQSWSVAYVYFRHEDTGTAPRYAAQLMKIAAPR